MIDAVAGSGKTTTMLTAASCIPRNTPVLILAFNKAIATEIDRRLPQRPAIRCQTLHGFGYGVLRNELGNRVTLGERVKGLDPHQQKLLQAWTGGRRDVVEGTGFSAWQAAAASGKLLACLKNGMILDDKTMTGKGRVVPKKIRQAVTSYYNGFREAVADLIVESDHTQLPVDGLKITFDDMIDLPHAAVSRQFGGRDQVPGDLDWVDGETVVMVDEAQDLNPFQLQILYMLGARRYLFFGDPHQSIYGWRGADPKAWEKLKTQFNCQPAPLSVTWRCCPEIVEQAQTRVHQIQAAPEASPGQVEHIDHHTFFSQERFRPQEGDLVVCRNNAPLIRLRLQDIQAQRPSQYEGKDLEKDIAALCRPLMAENAPATLAKLSQKAEEIGEVNPHSILLDYLDCAKHVVRSVETTPATEATPFDRAVRGNDPAFWEPFSIRLAEVFSDLDGGPTYTTIHKSKGREADTVWFYGPELTNRAGEVREAERQQEENCWYVAVTRAKSRLIYVNLPR